MVFLIDLFICVQQSLDDDLIQVACCPTRSTADCFFYRMRVRPSFSELKKQVLNRSVTHNSFPANNWVEFFLDFCVMLLSSCIPFFFGGWNFSLTRRISLIKSLARIGMLALVFHDCVEQADGR